MLIKKLALGTVQFGLNYGISNTHGIPADSELLSILDCAKQSGITMLDTAAAYGNAEERLGLHATDRFKIVTKFSKVDSEFELKAQLESSLTKLKTPKIYGYLAHNADFLIEKPDLWKVLQSAKSENKVHKIGYSLYHPDQLQQLLALDLVPDIVQLPYSLLDRKFEKQLAVLKTMGTEIHIRSVFLQGLYFVDLQHLPSKLESMRPSLQSLQALCAEANIAVGAVALNFVVSNPNIDRIVIGVENAGQLQNNIDMIQSWKPNDDLFLKIKAIEVENSALLNPSNW